MITANEYASRRQRLISMMLDNSVLILFSGVEKKSSADEFFRFEVNRNFYYLTGIDQPDSSLIIVNADGEIREFLFVSPYEPIKEKWYGKILTRNEAATISGVANTQVNTALNAKVMAILDPSLSQYGDIENVYIDMEPEIKIAQEKSTLMYKAELAAQ